MNHIVETAAKYAVEVENMNYWINLINLPVLTLSSIQLISLSFPCLLLYVLFSFYHFCPFVYSIFIFITTNEPSLFFMTYSLNVNCILEKIL